MWLKAGEISTVVCQGPVSVFDAGALVTAGDGLHNPGRGGGAAQSGTLIHGGACASGLDALPHIGGLTVASDALVPSVAPDAIAAAAAPSTNVLAAGCVVDHNCKENGVLSVTCLSKCPLHALLSEEGVAENIQKEKGRRPSYGREFFV